MTEEVTETEESITIQIMKGQSREVVSIDDLAMTGENIINL